ncbi:MAG: SHOCT domain-containing protein [bacterium]
MKNLFFFILFLFKPIRVFAHVDNWHMDRWGHMSGYGFGGIIIWIILLILVALVIYFITQNIKLRSSGHSSGETPLDILKTRYAKGEISKEEFNQMKKDLEA